MNGGNAGMIERSQNFRFALESQETLGIACECIRQDLNCYIALQLGVARAINLTHSACSETRHDFVGSELRAHRNRHRSRRIIRWFANISGLTELFRGSVTTDIVFAAEASGLQATPRVVRILRRNRTSGCRAPAVRCMKLRRELFDLQ